jgi:hypothetical protein
LEDNLPTWRERVVNDTLDKMCEEDSPEIREILKTQLNKYINEHPIILADEDKLYQQILYYREGYLEALDTLQIKYPDD